MISEYNTAPTWDKGDTIFIQTDNWDLSGVAKGVYTLRVKNAFEWSQCKLKSLTLDYDGEIPTDEQDIRVTEENYLLNGQAYDILGRPVDKSYNGIIIQNGKKYIILCH